ncbi:MAG: protein-L-isoaspartate O-methyltransferase [Aestuariivirga sp.]|uniref:protein-L-isoaspartate O-methyltransferase family protein n=1 Tax=Aestuariivirga sp. TaxID=2650926 RepID=UPI0025BBB113|nr:protein-L-isoaspartate O-methyltransferase [Aestuariivirga sp.]MCA3560298.1 protein-L-isoaspartate O-methyltransferase [Aestuariivirga sp.]
MTDFAAARRNMVESQVRPNGITDRRIIAAIEAVPREDFVPESRRALAYMDEDVPLDHHDRALGQRALIEIMAFARMLQHAAIKPTDKLLIIGAGTGYGAAVAAQIAATVVALESDAGLAHHARSNLRGLANVKLVEGPLAGGVAAEQPFDVILLEGRAEDVPQSLIDQLADGGRLIGVVGERETSQACIYSRSGGLVAVRPVFDASVTALPGLKKKKPAFVF